ncbi:hypothetical protein M3N64_00740 [Sporolactobacillus sp. CPB3-1]|uniref:Glycosyltransferase RgtA/B/C/D-like domain-containing protein n=1 Tax=Sporolactobacillus mangiferae TaxID=2940498 RepID=A0ABT0M6I2_9BACL|nr:hypothetical protein [Sporolactobacillus mangiferae]MCL1630480.1 hypothetical protein [Sporolactobacillus mangiferae]
MYRILKNNSLSYNKIFHIFTPSLIASLGIGVVTSLLLFVPPYKGVADNGDFFRVAYSNGLYYLPHYDSNYFGYFVRQYGLLNYYNENGSTYFSSQSLFIQLSIMLNRLFFSSHIFDIRFQAVIYVLLLMIGIYLLVESLTCMATNVLSGYFVAGLTVFIFGDSAYTEYFNSLYSESTMYVSFIFIAAFSLLLYRNRYNNLLLVILYTVSAVIFVTLKQQNAPLSLIFALFGMSFCMINKNRFFRWTVVFLMLVILGSGVMTYHFISDEFNNINQYQALTRGVLLNSKDPEQSLQSLGINKQYALLRESIYYQQYSTVGVNSNELRKGLYDHYNFVSISIYYIKNLDQFVDLLNTAAVHWFDVRPMAMGNFERSSGYAFGAHTSFFSGYNTIRKLIAPGRFGFIVVFGLLVSGCYLFSFIQAYRQKKKRLFIRFFLILTFLLLGTAATMMSIIGDGDADLSKHLLLFPITFDCMITMFLSDLITKHVFKNHGIVNRKQDRTRRREMQENLPSTPVLEDL